MILTLRDGKREAARFAACTAAAVLLAACGSGGGNGTGAAPPKTVTTGPNSHVHALEVLPNGVLMLADQEGIWTGSADGRDWRPTGPPLNKMMATCLVQTVTVELACTTTLSTRFTGAPRGVWRTSDGGRRWKRSPLPDLTVPYMATNPDVPGTVVAFARADGPTATSVGHGGVWLSRTSGRSWLRVNSALAQSSVPVIGLLLLPGKPFTVVLAETTGLRLSFDGGRKWVTKSLPGSTILALAADRTDPKAGYFATVMFPSTSGRIWETLDGGRTWAPLWHIPLTDSLVSSGLAHGLYGYSSSPKPLIYRAYREGCRLCAGPAHLLVKRGSAPATSNQVALAPDLAEPLRIYSAWSFPLRLYRSDNGGKTWRKLL